MQLVMQLLSLTSPWRASCLQEVNSLVKVDLTATESSGDKLFCMKINVDTPKAAASALKEGNPTCSGPGEFCCPAPSDDVNNCPDSARTSNCDAKKSCCCGFAEVLSNSVKLEVENPTCSGPGEFCCPAPSDDVNNCPE